MRPMICLPRIAGVVIAAGVFCAASLSFGQARGDAEAGNQEMWREAIAHSEVPAEGCFHASYPNLTWEKWGAQSPPPSHSC
jgi:hypothetical protein